MDNKFEWGDIITITLKNGDSFTVLLEETGRLSGKSCPVSDLRNENQDLEIRYATPDEIREFMRGLFNDGRLLHQGFDTINKPSHYADSKIDGIPPLYLSKYFNDLRENVHFDALGKRELDIYIPSLQLAVEYDGHKFDSGYDPYFFSNSGR